MFWSSSLRRSRALLAVVSVGFGLCLAELIAVAGLAHSQTGWLGDPGHYFDPLCDEDYWRALRRGAYGADLHRVGPNEQDSRLGWIPARTSLDSNLALRPPPSPATSVSTVAIFGDSYVFGTTKEGHRVTDHLRRLRPSTAVHNFGVGGYGLDQVLLRLEDRVSVLKPGDTVVLGVLTTDIDRAILRVRDAPKPWFELGRDGTLVEHAPDGGDVMSWFDSHPVQAPILLWHRVNRTLQLQRAAKLPSTQPSCREEDKTALARALLNRMGEVCKKNALRCHLLALYRPIDLQHGAGWRRAVLTEDHGMQVLDSWTWFHNEEDGWEDSYGMDRHPNSRGNAHLASGIDAAITFQSMPDIIGLPERQTPTTHP